jgi:8-oxo-dGTP diphosphatase
VIEAAGGVVWRRTAKGNLKVLVVHRPAYDDWSLPKGKLEPGESHRRAAEREVLEETGYECEVGDELEQVRYRDHKDRPKRVRYWAMEAVAGGFEPNDEVDEVRWVARDDAADLLTYGWDAELVGQLSVPAHA